MSERAKKVLVFSVAQIITIFINFLVSPYLSRALPKEDYSAYNQVIVVIGLAGVLFAFGIQSVAFLFFSKKDEDQAQVISTMQAGVVWLGLFSSVTLFLLSYQASGLFEQKNIAIYLRMCAPAVFVTFINNYLQGVLVYNGRTKYVAFLSVFNAAFTVTFLYLSLNVWKSVSYALIFSQVVAPLISLSLALVVAFKFLVKKLRVYKAAAKKILKVSVPLYITSLLGSSYIYFSAFFVILILGDIEYANYRNGAVEIPFISTVAFSVSAILLPDLNRYFHEGQLLQAYELKKKIINQCIFLLYPVIVFFIVYHYEFIVSYFSIKYAESALVFAVYSITCFVRINDYQDVLITAGKSSYILKSNIVYFLTNIILVTILGYMFGIYGVAVAASISVFLLAYILLRKDAEIFGVRISSFFQLKQIALVFLISAGLAIVLKILLNNVFGLHPLIVFLIAAAVYFPVVYIYISRNGLLLPSLVGIVTNKVPALKPLLNPRNK